jgi:hypothetical protein
VQQLTCTSAGLQDTDYPVRELLYHSPQTRGWQSPRWGWGPATANALPQCCHCNSQTATGCLLSSLPLCRFCKYPQELVLRLERPSKVQQIQILAHEYKVQYASCSEHEHVPAASDAPPSCSTSNCTAVTWPHNHTCSTLPCPRRCQADVVCKQRHAANSACHLRPPPCLMTHADPYQD